MRHCKLICLIKYGLAGITDKYFRIIVTYISESKFNKLQKYKLAISLFYMPLAIGTKTNFGQNFLFDMTMTNILIIPS